MNPELTFYGMYEETNNNCNLKKKNIKKLTALVIKIAEQLDKQKQSRRKRKT